LKIIIKKRNRTERAGNSVRFRTIGREKVGKKGLRKHGKSRQGLDSPRKYQRKIEAEIPRVKVSSSEFLERADPTRGRRKEAGIRRYSKTLPLKKGCMKAFQETSIQPFLVLGGN